MAATTFTTAFAVPQRSLRSLVTLFAKEAKYEVLKNIRIPIYAASTVVFPLMFYVLFGIVLAPGNPVNRSQDATYLLATMGTFGVMGASLFGFAVSLAMERGQGWLQVKRASPMPLAAYFAAKLASAMLFSFTIAVALLAIGFVFAQVRVAPLQAAELIGVLMMASIPFGAMGLALGYIAKPNSAPAVVNLIYLPLSFCSGLWIPVFLLPKFLQEVARALPPFHISQLALRAVGMGRDAYSVNTHIEALVGFTLLFLGIAVVLYRRDEGQLYG
ncbi:MAG TPA: ABC transporter permease [Candidatus Angelobacter sp.]|jgi:ABC-2 type transport system permease protein|nr:ABC transporter permease [Candidatus Angelobacter sp.]